MRRLSRGLSLMATLSEERSAVKEKPQWLGSQSGPAGRGCFTGAVGSVRPPTLRQVTFARLQKQRLLLVRKPGKQQEKLFLRSAPLDRRGRRKSTLTPSTAADASPGARSSALFAASECREGSRGCIPRPSEIDRRLFAALLDGFLAAARAMIPLDIRWLYPPFSEVRSSSIADT